MLQRILIFLLLAGSAHTAGATVFTGEGRAPTLTEARTAALGALAESLYVQIESRSDIRQSDQGDNSFRQHIRSHTDIPLLGAQTECVPLGADHFCTSQLNASDARPRYQGQRSSLVSRIQDNLRGLANTPEAQRHQSLSDLLGAFNQLRRLERVQQLLTTDARFQPARFDVSEPQLRQQLSALESKPPTLALAADLMIRGLPEARYDVLPATAPNSREITPFASALQRQMQEAIATRRLTQANGQPKTIRLQGQYLPHDQGIQVSYTALNEQGEALHTRVLELPPASYAAYRFQPQAPDFDQLLHQGYVLGDHLRAQINTNKGSRDLLFREGETIQLLVKLNRPGYFYLVGHSKNTGMEMSYLLDLDEAGTDRRFVRYVNADDANKWLTLGEFETSAPFGLESLQLFASEQDLVNRLPGYQYDTTSGYYRLASNIAEGVQKTRGLKKVKKGPAVSSEVIESVLMFTTEAAQ